MDAPIVQMGVTAQGEMEAPPFTARGATEVAWYNPDTPNKWRNTPLVMRSFVVRRAAQRLLRSCSNLSGDCGKTRILSQKESRLLP